MTSFLEISLLAAGEFWETVIGILFFILWIVFQLVGNREAPAPKKKKQARRPRPQPVQAGKVQPPRNQEETLRNEVEDFLRRQSQNKPAQNQPAKELPRETQPRTLVDQQQMPRPSQVRLPADEPVLMEVVENTPRREGVAEHVTKHLSTQDIAAHTAALGQKIGQTDERMEAHLQEKFDHSLGNLEHVETSVDTKSRGTKSDHNDIASDIAAMLSNPQGMRQIIIANEILRRPEW